MTFLEKIMSNCPFCNIDDKRIISNYDDYYVIRDLFPVTELHTLIIPKRCCSYFDLNDRELNNLQQIIKKEKEELINIDKTISGFNLGVNDGLDGTNNISLSCSFDSKKKMMLMILEGVRGNSFETKVLIFFYKWYP